MKLALVGCGNIAERYARRITEEPSLELVGATDIVRERAQRLTTAFGIREYPSLDALLADESVDTVVNLAAPQAHAELTARSLEADKHVHTEKPVALTYDEARELAALADSRGVRLSCSPATWLGEGVQTAWRLVRDDAIGAVRAVYAEANWGRIERWHPTPESLYAAGPLIDVGIYPLAALTAIFGPARRALAYATILERDRVARDGRAFQIDTPDFTVAVLEFENGVVARLTATFWVGPGKQRGIEFHGQHASLYLASWAEFDSRLERSEDGETYERLPLLREPYRGIDWAAPLVDLADALAAGRPHRARPDHAAHVVDTINAIEASRERGTVEIRSSFEPPPPMDWAR